VHKGGVGATALTGEVGGCLLHVVHGFTPTALWLSYR
jgi:hypothetical protein